jgi:chromosome segregation ATPase
VSKDTLKKVVDAQELEWATRSGWQLHSVLEEEHVVQLHRELDELEPPRWQGDIRERKKLLTEAVAKRHRYLMFKSVDTAIGELETTLHDLRRELEEQRKQTETATKKYGEVNDALERRKTEVASLEEQLKALRAELKGVRETKGRMEQDFAAIKRDIGDAAVKRILEGVTR